MIDFLVPLSNPNIVVRDLVEDSQIVLKDLLRLKFTPTLQIEFIQEGGILLDSFEVLEKQDEGRGLNIFLGNSNTAEIQVFVFDAVWSGKDIPTLSISPAGAGRIQASLVLCAVCAISVARANKTFIEDSANVFNCHDDNDAETLFTHLRCKNESTDLFQSLEEVWLKMRIQ